MKTRKRIDSMTDAEKAQMAPWAEKWVKIGLSTEPADWERFDRGVLAAYKFAGLAPPKVIVRVDSPIVCAFAGSIANSTLKNRTKRSGGAVYVAVLGAVDGAVEDAVNGAVRGAVDDAVNGAVGGAVEDAVLGAVGGAVDDAVDGAVRGAVRGAVDDAVGNWYRYYGNQFWCWFEAYSSFMREVLHLELSPDIAARSDAAIDMASSACWAWMHTDFVIVSNRPSEIHRDDRGRPHNEGGMAIKFRDGWGIYSINGTRVPERVVMSPESLTVQEIKAEKNAEVRRIMRERYGEGRYLNDIGAKVLDVDMEGARKGAAPRALLVDDEDRRFMAVTDGSTGRVYYLEVPSEVKTCREGHRALCGFDESKILAKS